MTQYLNKVCPFIENTIYTLYEWMMPFYFYSETLFCDFADKINFQYFCCAYSIIFLFIFYVLSRKQNFRPKPKELKTWNKKLKESAMNIIFEIPFIKSFVYGKFNSELAKQEKQLIKDLSKDWDERKSKSLPYEGMSQENLKKRIHEWAKKEKKLQVSGKISGALYTTDEDHYESVNSFGAMYMYQNPLHLDTFKELLKMESEVIKMTGNLLTQKNQTYYGALTSGGSESLMLALYAYRNCYSWKKKPNIVVPVTAHVALDKGCFYFNIEARKARLDSNYQVDVKHLESLIDKNTIMILGSAPNYPHGIADPIDKLAKIAIKYKIGFHVDGCLGGFVGTFHNKHKELYSLDREGVTSVSLDQHKFGLAPKGVSSIFYKTKELRHYQYFVIDSWTGGLYATPSFPGSRSGFPSAGAWYSLTQLTKKQFKYNAEEIVNATEEAAKKLRSIKGIKVFGEPHLCVIAFTPTECSHLALSDFLNHNRSWNVAPIHKPDGIHISLTLANYENVKNKLPKDIQDGLNFLQSQSKEKVKQSASSVIYGANTKIPTGFMQNEVLKCCIRASLK